MSTRRQAQEERMGTSLFFELAWDIGAGSGGKVGERTKWRLFSAVRGNLEDKYSSSQSFSSPARQIGLRL